MVATVPLVRAAEAAAASDRRAYRLTSLDMLRGLVIVIMAIDHVRDFFLASAQQDPMADPNVTVALFATRWITHFCAPVFVFLAGTSAGLMKGRMSAGDLARLLLLRGVWLIAVEMFIVSTLSTFSPRGIPELGGQTLFALQVIWAIGVSMIVLSGAQLLGRRACLVIGALIVASHNLVDPVWPRTGLLEMNWPVWAALHSQMAHNVGPFMFVFIYPVWPWIGVMLLGCGVSSVFELPAGRRDSVLLKAGAVMTASFIAIRFLGWYGDPNPWQWQERGLVATIMDFLNTTKYPPSLDFLLMTLGPAAMLSAVADRVTGGIKNALVTFGRVPFAFYVAHIALIHVLSVLLGIAQGFRASQLMTIFFFYPAGYGLPLPGVYIVWALVIAILYPLCRWVAALKSRRRDWWLSYV